MRPAFPDRGTCLRVERAGAPAGACRPCRRRRTPASVRPGGTPGGAASELAPLPPSPGTRIASRDGGSSGRGRRSAQAATAPATPADDPARPAGRGAAPRAGAAPARPPCGTVGDRPRSVDPPPASASPNSWAEPQRSAGSFCSAVRTASSTAGGTVGRLGRSGGGCSVSTFATIACELGPVNGGSPASIS